MTNQTAKTVTKYLNENYYFDHSYYNEAVHVRNNEGNVITLFSIIDAVKFVDSNR